MSNCKSLLFWFSLTFFSINRHNAQEILNKNNGNSFCLYKLDIKSKDISSCSPIQMSQTTIQKI